MNKRFFPITAITAALLLVAVFGYLHIAPAQDLPPRLVLDNAGGRVLFSHGHHAEDLGLECGDCHHADPDPARPELCGSCHPVAFDAAYAEAHLSMFKDQASCAACHEALPSGQDVARQPFDFSHIPLRTEAFHAQCLNCHERSGAGPYGEKSCNSCHLQRK